MVCSKSRQSSISHIAPLSVGMGKMIDLSDFDGGMIFDVGQMAVILASVSRVWGK